MRGGVGSDAEVSAIVEATRQAIVDRLVATVGHGPRAAHGAARLGRDGRGRRDRVGRSAVTSSARSCARCSPTRCTVRSRAPGRWRRSAMSPSAMTGVPLAPLTTLRLGGPAAKVVEAHTDERARRGRARLRRGRRAAAGARRRLERRDRRRGLRRDGRARAHPRRRARRDARWTSPPASRGTTSSRRAVDGGLAGIECLSGHPGLDRRHADPERRRLRPGRRADDHERARLRPRAPARSRTCRRGAGLRLPHQRAAPPRPPHRAARALRAGRIGAVGRRCATPSCARRRRRARAAGRRARGRARAAARQGDGRRPRRPGLGVRRLVLHQPDPATPPRSRSSSAAPARRRRASPADGGA